MKKRFLILVSGLFGLILAAGPVRAESRMEKTLKLEPGGEFSIDTDTGRVTVTGASISAFTSSSRPAESWTTCSGSTSKRARGRPR